MDEIPTITRGNLEPPLAMTISDARADADFSTITASACRFTVEQGGVLIIDDVATSVTPAADGKSAVVRRAWGIGETDIVGRCWVTCNVAWTASREQTFPDEGPLRLDIVPAAGDA